jgi:hypothetical protein
MKSLQSVLSEYAEHPLEFGGDSAGERLQLDSLKNDLEAISERNQRVFLVCVLEC